MNGKEFLDKDLYEALEQLEKREQVKLHFTEDGFLIKGHKNPTHKNNVIKEADSLLMENALKHILDNAGAVFTTRNGEITGRLK